jgi:alkylation response protein AidB-like acyl-CoA dehydrogenase
VDFAPSPEQAAIVEAVERLLASAVGPGRAAELARGQRWDEALERALADAGFLDTALETGPLEAALVVEAVARAGGAVAIGAGALVAPLLAGRRLPGPVALAHAPGREPTRFADRARTLLLCEGDAARIVAVEPGDFALVRSGFGYPLGRLVRDLGARGERLAPGSGERLLAWWRVALAAEALGAMQAALDTTVAHVKQRRQFGRAIGSFQAVQHRLAHCAVLVEGSRWLVYEAAQRGAPAEAAATAAAHALGAAGTLFAETHQLSGAMGFTREHALHVWSMRLVALRLEAGGPAAHRRAAAEARWRPQDVGTGR